MKIFISSLIGGFGEFRAAARSAIVALRHEPVVAEDFGAQPNSPQIACLQGVRSSDLVVLILGARYGFVQGSSGVSPTHEEYLEARGSKPILMFVQEGVERDEQQAKLVSDAGAWQAGHFRAGFKTADELRDLVTRAIHDYQLANAAGPLDTGALSAAALALLPRSRQNSQASSPVIHVAICGGPMQRLLRPAELEAPELADGIHQQALFAEPRLFSKSKGADSSIEGSALVLEQERGAHQARRGWIDPAAPAPGTLRGKPPQWIRHVRGRPGGCDARAGLSPFLRRVAFGQDRPNPALDACRLGRVHRGKRPHGLAHASGAGREPELGDHAHG